jgi:hypothetical protein
MNTAKLLNAHSRLTTEKLKVIKHHQEVSRSGMPVHTYRIQDVKDGDVVITVQHVGKNRASAMANWICAITNTIKPFIETHYELFKLNNQYARRINQLENDNLRKGLEIERLRRLVKS